MHASVLLLDHRVVVVVVIVVVVVVVIMVVLVLVFVFVPAFVRVLMVCVPMNT